MTDQEVRARIEQIGIIPSIRVSSAEDALFAATTVFQGGIKVVEITTTVPGAADVIAQLKRTDPHVRCRRRHGPRYGNRARLSRSGG